MKLIEKNAPPHLREQSRVSPHGARRKGWCAAVENRLIVGVYVCPPQIPPPCVWGLVLPYLQLRVSNQTDWCWGPIWHHRPYVPINFGGPTGSLSGNILIIIRALACFPLPNSLMDYACTISCKWLIARSFPFRGVVLIVIVYLVCGWLPACVAAYSSVCLVISFRRYQLLSLMHLWPRGSGVSGKSKTKSSKAHNCWGVRVDITRTGVISISQPNHAFEAGDQTQVTSAFSSEAKGERPRENESSKWEEELGVRAKQSQSKRQREAENVTLPVLFICLAVSFTQNQVKLSESIQWSTRFFTLPPLVSGNVVICEKLAF